jgi:LysW-gamma-L-lysine carboxypeptidase
MDDFSQADAFLEQFVRIPSPSRQEAAAATFLVEQMRALGFMALQDEAGNAVAQVGTQGPLVVLLGHIDTVPGAVPVRIDDGVLYGRGSVDAKGPFATFVWATLRAKQAGTLGCRVVLVGAVEEEAATSKGAYFVADQYAPDYCVIGEPSGWERVTLGYKGRLLIHYRHEQPGAHSAGEIHAAPEHLVDYWLAVRDLCAAYNQGRERLFEQLLPALRDVESGSDGLNDWVEALIGLRLPEGIVPEALADDLRGLLRQPATGQGRTTLAFEGACPAFRSPRTTPLASAFVRAIRSSSGTPGFVHKTGTSDMNVVGPAWACPVVAYGPGDSRLDHSPNEHLPLDDYHRAIVVLAEVLSNLH